MSVHHWSTPASGVSWDDGRQSRRRPRDSALRIGLVYPELLGTYGDRGNAVVLVQRARWRGTSLASLTTKSALLARTSVSGR